MSFLSGIGLKVWGYVLAAVAVIAALATAFRKGEKSGRNEVTVEVQNETEEARERMLRSAINSPVEKADVSKAARSGNF
jgi:hypothetical protein